MPLDVQGILENISLSAEQTTVLYPYLREVFINETPLVSRTRREPAEGQVYNIVSYDVRPRTYTLNAAVAATNADTNLTLVDATPLMLGDVLELIKTDGTATERLEVKSITSGTVVVVRRARESTTAVANDTTGGASANVVTLIGNSRTGAEIDQQAKRTVRTLTPQYVQTFQNPVQVGGLANAVRNIRLPSGISDVFSLEQKVAMTEMMRDEEYTSYYGLGEAPVNPGDRAKQKGLKKQITGYNAGANVRLAAGASYTFLNFVADGIQKCIDGGGDPDAVLCSTSFLTGLQTWGFAKMQVTTPRASLLGLPINEIAVPFASGVVSFIPSFQLKPGTACVLTSSDVLMRYIRQEFWNQRGNRGDAREGDFIADVCVEVGHPGWHSWVEGITSFA
jgi:hypothetical protein